MRLGSVGAVREPLTDEIAQVCRAVVTILKFRLLGLPGTRAPTAASVRFLERQLEAG